MNVPYSPETIGYVIRRDRNLTLIHRPELSQLWETARSRGPLGRLSPLNGRSTLRLIEPDMVVRTLMHGGVLRFITGRSFLSPARTLRELKVSVYLVSKGIRTPEILAVRLRKNALFYHIDVITRLIPDSTDLLTYLEVERDDGLDLLMKAGSLIRKIHDLGVYHADLHIKNIILDGTKHLWVLDLDKAYHFTSLPVILKRLNLGRFMRSVRKWRARGRIHLDESWEKGFVLGYEEGEYLG